MIKYTMYYPGSKATKILTLSKPVSDDILRELAHDFRASLAAPRPTSPATSNTLGHGNSASSAQPLTKEQIAKDKAAITTAIRAHRQFKNKNWPLYSSLRDDALRVILAAQTPRWGSVRVTVTKSGV